MKDTAAIVIRGKLFPPLEDGVVGEDYRRWPKTVQDRFHAIRQLYKYEPIRDSLRPYKCFLPIMSDIEEIFFERLRATRTLLYPQFPIGKRFVDFGNPAWKIGVEVDGLRWHQDPSKDYERAKEIMGMGWRLFHVRSLVIYENDPDEKTFGIDHLIWAIRRMVGLDEELTDSEVWAGVEVSDRDWTLGYDGEEYHFEDCLAHFEYK